MLNFTNRLDLFIINESVRSAQVFISTAQIISDECYWSSKSLFPLRTRTKCASKVGDGAHDLHFTCLCMWSKHVLRATKIMWRRWIYIEFYTQYRCTAFQSVCVTGGTSVPRAVVRGENRWTLLVVVDLIFFMSYISISAFVWDVSVCVCVSSCVVLQFYTVPRKYAQPFFSQCISMLFWTYSLVFAITFSYFFHFHHIIQKLHKPYVCRQNKIELFQQGAVIKSQTTFKRKIRI